MDRAPPPFVDMSAKSRFLIDAFSRYFPNYANNQGYLVEVSLKLDYTLLTQSYYIGFIPTL